MPAHVVATSRTAGASGEAVGLGVAKDLGFQCIDEETIPIAAAKAGVDPVLVADAAEGADRALRPRSRRRRHRDVGGRGPDAAR